MSGGVNPALPVFETDRSNGLRRCGHSAEQVTPGRSPGSRPTRPEGGRDFIAPTLGSGAILCAWVEQNRNEA